MAWVQAFVTIRKEYITVAFCVLAYGQDQKITRPGRKEASTFTSLPSLMHTYMPTSVLFKKQSDISKNGRRGYGRCRLFSPTER